MAPRDPRFSRRTAWNLAPNRLSVAAKRRRLAGRPVLDLTESNPTRCGFQYDEGCIHEALSDPRGFEYEPQPFGLDETRAAVAEYYAARGTMLKPDQVLLTAGSSEAYTHLFRLLADPGDNVLAPTPSYPLFDFLAGLNDIAVESYRLEHHRCWETDFASLEAACNERTRAVVVVHPNNPTGSLAGPEDRDRIEEFCAARGLALIADEVFLDYCFPEARGRAGTFAGRRKTLTFTLNGLSKTAALPQMKLGWMVVSGPDGVTAAAKARLELILDTYLSVGTPVQRAAGRLLAGCGAIQRQILERATRNLQALDTCLGRQQVSSRLEVEGGWSVVLRVPSIRSDEEWALELLEEEGILVHPGHFFEFHTEGYLVLSLIVPEVAFGAGVSRLLGLIAAAAGGRR